MKGQSCPFSLCLDLGGKIDMIHQYKLHGNNIVLDVGSGAVHLVDHITYDLLEALGQGKPEEEGCPKSVIEQLKASYHESDICEAYVEILELVKQGKLFAADDYSPYAKNMSPSPIKAMCLHVAHDCNLRCAYCFASTGDFEGSRCLMDVNTGKKAIDFLIEKSGDRHNLELDFFGGEPLMNFQVVKEVVHYARGREKETGKNFRFTITTNGILLNDEVIDFVNQEMSNVVLSIDGRKEINDNMRPLAGGQGSYDLIVPKFQKLVSARGEKQYYVRGTFTKNNLDFANDVFHLYDQGFTQISVEPVVSDGSLPYAIGEEDIPAICNEYEHLAKRLLEAEAQGKAINFFHFMIDLNGGPCVIKLLRGCGCGNEYVAVTPEGDIYPCHQFVGKKEWKLGSLYEEGFRWDMKAEFSKVNIYSKEECPHCWARFYCSGGCMANSIQYMGNVHVPHKISCELEKKRVECAVMMQVERTIRQQENASRAVKLK